MAVFAGLSVHLQPGRVNGPKMNHPDEMYIDLGAKNPEEVRAAGVDVLDPIVPQTNWMAIGKSGEAGLGALNHVDNRGPDEADTRDEVLQVKGTTTVAFVAQQYTGGARIEPDSYGDSTERDDLFRESCGRSSQPTAKLCLKRRNPGLGLCWVRPPLLRRQGRSLLKSFRQLRRRSTSRT